MNDFIRARTDGQKEIRMKEIKDAADSLFAKMPFSDITLTVIAENLGWSRANLYKYVTTKEEIFLEISAMPALSADEAYKLQQNVLMFAATKIR